MPMTEPMPANAESPARTIPAARATHSLSRVFPTPSPCLLPEFRTIATRLHPAAQGRGRAGSLRLLRSCDTQGHIVMN
jgi:hypothetical protein